MRLAVLLALLAPATAPGQSLPRTEDRPVPDYDGREPPPTTPGEGLLWVPRVVLFPAHLVAEYLLRRPIGFAASWLERNHVPAKVKAALNFGPGDRFAVYPIAEVDFGLRPSIGLLGIARDTPGRNDALRLHVGYGGSDWRRVTVRERLFIGGDPDDLSPFGHDELSFHFVYEARPDHVFHGLGPTAPDVDTRFKWTRLGGHIDGLVHLGRYDGLEAAAEVWRNDFGPGDSSYGDEAIEDVFALDTLPGFDGYTLGLARASAVFDTRRPRSQAGSGIRVAGSGAYGRPLDDGDYAFVRWSAEAAFFLDLDGHNRVLSLSPAVAMIHGLGDDPIPLVERPSLGGVERLRGFLEGRYRGDSLATASLDYTWPVWSFLDGLVFYDVGNVFGPRLEGFELEALASSFGFGLRTSVARDWAFDLLVGAGTTRFDAPDYGVENVRFQIGVTGGP